VLIGKEWMRKGGSGDGCAVGPGSAAVCPGMKPLDRRLFPGRGRTLVSRLRHRMGRRCGQRGSLGSEEAAPRDKMSQDESARPEGTPRSEPPSSDVPGGSRRSTVGTGRTRAGLVGLLDPPGTFCSLRRDGLARQPVEGFGPIATGAGPPAGSPAGRPLPRAWTRPPERSLAHGRAPRASGQQFDLERVAEGAARGEARIQHQGLEAASDPDL
jgi:hypothetical protein